MQCFRRFDLLKVGHVTTRGSLLLVLGLTICVLVAGAAQSSGAADPASEYEVKAAFLYNFTKFVEWPDTAFTDDKAPVVICIFGNDPFGTALDPMESMSAQGRKFLIKRCKSLDQLRTCHVVFISQSERDRLATILAYLAKSGALTIGDMEGFAEAGGMINLYEAGNKIRFAINVDAAQSAGLRISSQLLALAKIVKNPH